MSMIPDEVIRRYASKHGMPTAESFGLFEKLEGFLDVAAVRSVAPSENIDSAWHEFILHTKLYAGYCLERYGHFVHHVPTSPLVESLDVLEKRFVQSCKASCSSGGSDPFEESCESGPCASDCRSSCKSEVYEIC